MIIKFFFNGIDIRVSERKRLKRFITEIFQNEGKALSSVLYIICTDRYLLSVNKEFLHHNEYTDIITFSLSKPNEPILGEIYISAERVRENAKKYGIPITIELHRLFFHGALHLCGYVDKNPIGKKRMTHEEDKYLRLYFDTLFHE